MPLSHLLRFLLNYEIFKISNCKVEAPVVGSKPAAGRAGRSHLGSVSQWCTTNGAGAGAVSLSSAPVSEPLSSSSPYTAHLTTDTGHCSDS